MPDESADVTDLDEADRAALPRNSKILVAMWEAEDRGDQAEADRLFSALDIPAHTLMALKNMPGGADWIRKHNLRTHLADEKYGPGWLDRTEEEEFARARAAGRH